MKEKFKEFWEKCKTFWGGLAKKVRIIIIAALAVVIVAAVVITVVLNNKSSDGYIVLFPDMTSEESTEVYLELQNKNVPTRINSEGEIEVPEAQWDNLVYELAELGYPQSTPSYGTFFDNLSMTMTEFEKQQTLRFALQDRLQVTIERINGVKAAIVTINVPESSNYAWQENNESATASVTLTLENPDKFSPESVAAIKNLVAYSTQKMQPSDVTVIDAVSGTELLAAGIDIIEDDKEGLSDTEERINFANVFKNQYEQNAKTILEGIYGKGNVVAVANVTVDYDKITQEMKEYITDENGEGAKTTESVAYGGPDITVNAGGIVGEENNSDIPNYDNVDEDTLTNEDLTEYERYTEWVAGYILTQSEKAQGVVTDATISVVVKSDRATLTQNERDNLVALVRNATNIPNDKISVYNTQLLEEEQLGGGDDTAESISKKFILIICLIILTALLLIILIAFLLSRSARKKLAAQRRESQRQIVSLQEELEETTRQSLVDAANDSTFQQQATANEVRDWVKLNPEITAAIIRSMIREDDSNQ